MAKKGYRGKAKRAKRETIKSRPVAIRGLLEWFRMGASILRQVLGP